MEFKEGMVFKCSARYYVLALIRDGEYLMLSEDESYGWDLKDSSIMYEIYSSDTYNGYVPIKPNGRQTKFVTGWWYGERQLIATFTYVGDLEEVKHHFIVKDNMLDLYLRVKDDIGISFYGVTSVKADEMIDSFAEIFKDEQKEKMSLRTAMEYAESINDKVEEILQILKFLDEKGVQYSLTDDYFEVSVDNRHYTVTFKK